MPEPTRFEDLDPKVVKVLRITPATRDGKVLAVASVECGLWIVRGLRLMRGENGLTWLGMPGHKSEDGRWLDTCFVPARAARERLHEAVEDAYRVKVQQDGQDISQHGDKTDVPS